MGDNKKISLQVIFVLLDFYSYATDHGLMRLVSLIQPLKFDNHNLR